MCRGSNLSAWTANASQSDALCSIRIPAFARPRLSDLRFLQVHRIRRRCSDFGRAYAPRVRDDGSGRATTCDTPVATVSTVWSQAPADSSAPALSGTCVWLDCRAYDVSFALTATSSLFMLRVCAISTPGPGSVCGWQFNFAFKMQFAQLEELRQCATSPREMHGLSPTVFATTAVASRNLPGRHRPPRRAEGRPRRFSQHLRCRSSAPNRFHYRGSRNGGRPRKSATSTALRKFSKNYFFSVIAASTSSNSSSCARASSMESAGMFSLRELDSMLAVCSCRSGAATGFLSPMWRIVLPRWSTPPKRSKVPEGTYNVVDDDLPTSTEYLRQYRFHVGKMALIRLPLLLADGLSRGIERYHTYSKAQIPLLLTPYRVHSAWKGHLYSNSKLKSTGWQQAVPTKEALSRTFAYFNPNCSTTFDRSSRLAYGCSPPNRAAIQHDNQVRSLARSLS